MSERDKKADIALWDFGTRQGATAKKVKKQMQDAGFTEDEILAAVERMRGQRSSTAMTMPSAHHIDILAARVAVAMNGGSWHTHYTEAQKELWRQRVKQWL